MSKPRSSRQHQFLLTRHGRSSSKLAQSFTKFTDARINDLPRFPSIESFYDACYVEWKKTVREAHSRPRTSSKATPEQLYRAFENLLKKYDAEKDAHAITKQALKAAEKERLRLEKELEKGTRTVYLNPPAHVLRAMAVHGD